MCCVCFCIILCVLCVLGRLVCVCVFVYVCVWCVCVCVCVCPSWIAAPQWNKIYSCVNLMKVKYFAVLATYIHFIYERFRNLHFRMSNGAQFRLGLEYAVKFDVGRSVHHHTIQLN